MPNLIIQNFLRSGYSLDEIVDKYAIDFKRHPSYPNLVLLKYNQIKSDFSEKVVQECRGIILDEANDWAVVSMAFKKFHNLGEALADTIDWNTARCTEKIDGSLLTIYPFADRWQTQTTGTPDANTPINDFGITFKELFWQAFKYYLPSPNCGMCFFFELTSVYNRIVVKHSETKLTLLGARDLTSLQELTATEAQAYIRCPIVQEFPLNSFDACIESFSKMNPLEQEGYVVVDRAFNRVKIKHPGYVLLHHAKDGLLSQKSLVKIALEGEAPEVLTAFPEYKPMFDEVQDRLNKLIAILETDYAAIKHIEEQKAFALLAVKSKCSGALFTLRAGKTKGFREYLANIQIDNLMRLLEYK